jgi:hypothetical protein
VTDFFAERQEIIIPIAKNESQILGTMKKESDLALLKKIAKREETFKKCNPVTTSKPSNMETITFLKTLAGSKLRLANTSLRQGGVPRPCWHPNGTLIFVKNNKIELVKTNAVENNKNF